MKTYTDSKCKTGDLAILELSEEVLKKHSVLDRLEDYPKTAYASGYGDDPNEMDTDADDMMTANITLKDCPQELLVDDREAICAEEVEQNVCAVRPV